MRNDAQMTRTNRMALAQIRLRTRNEEQAGASLSGNERDHLFLNARGSSFTDIAGVAGLDDPADGRSSGILDYDRDGWLDLALVNSNAPMLELLDELGEFGRAHGRKVGRVTEQNHPLVLLPLTELQFALRRDRFEIRRDIADARNAGRHRLGHGSSPAEVV